MVTKNLLPSTGMTTNQRKAQRAHPPRSKHAWWPHLQEAQCVLQIIFPFTGSYTDFVNATTISSAKFRSFPRIRKTKKKKKSRNLIQHKAWTNLEKHILNSNQTLIIFLPLQKVNQEKYFKNSKLLSSKWHFISIPRCSGKQPSLPLTTVPVRAERWCWQWPPSVWKACWSLLPGLPVLWGGGKERGRLHRLQKKASWEG